MQQLNAEISPDLTFGHPDQTNSVEWELQYGFQAVQK